MNNDIQITYTRGTGPGGQHKNKRYTNNYVRSEVKDHRTGKTARLKDIMNGKLDLLK